MDFFARLDSIVRDKRSALCIGLDPRIEASDPRPAATALEKNRRLIAATADFAAAYKPNIAFYEALGPEGLSALEETLALIPRDIPVILDAKRGDIDSTAAAYAQAAFGRLKVDAVTLSPYMGRDTVSPFLAYEGKGLFLLCRTSNPGASAFQDIEVEAPASAGQGPGREAFYLRVARECLSWAPNIGLVVAGNDLAALAAVRAAAPAAWFLSPGIGAQGGEPAAAFSAGCREDGAGILVVVARAVADAADPSKAARELRDAMELARERALSGKPATKLAARGFSPAAPALGGEKLAGLKKDFIEALIRTECFRLGDFVLKSGKKSPFYIDLRRLVSEPAAMRLAGEAYASLARGDGEGPALGLAYERIAGIPAAGLPLATAASLALGKPMIWPRMPVKEHGSGNRIEGAWKPGEKALLLDDLITTGASKLEAIEILRGEGLAVEDLVVLIERGREGRKDMEAAGIRLHAFIHVRELFAVCERLGLIDAARRTELESFVEAE
jgi:uridine monophosphate synthetase